MSAFDLPDHLIAKADPKWPRHQFLMGNISTRARSQVTEHTDPPNCLS